MRLVAKPLTAEAVPCYIHKLAIEMNLQPQTVYEKLRRDTCKSTEHARNLTGALRGRM